MKRIVLFLATNLAVVVVLSIVLKVLGIGNLGYAGAGADYTGLLVFSAVVGFTGAIVSLLISKWVAKWSTGAHVIEQPQGEAEAWLVATVAKLAQKAGIGMPEVAIYEGEPNAFATGAFKNSSLVAGLDRLAAVDEQGRGRGGARPRDRAHRQRRHGDADADPGCGEYLRDFLCARGGVDRRSRGIQERARQWPWLLHHRARAGDRVRFRGVDDRRLVFRASANSVPTPARPNTWGRRRRWSMRCAGSVAWSQASCRRR